MLKTQAAGAKGVIVVDYGGCGKGGLVDCGQVDGTQDDGFARQDGPHTWSGVRIPVTLVSEAEGQRMKGMMHLRPVFVEGLGEQLVE